MEKIVRDLPEQFCFEPVIMRVERVPALRRTVVGGMGGSHLPAGILRTALPDFSLEVHHDYGLPLASKDEGTLSLAVSYSGNTEETLDFARQALAAGVPLAAISSGGALATLAEEHHLPFVLIPSGCRPRMATGYLFAAILALLGKEKERVLLARAARALPVGDVEKEGKALAAFFADGIAVLYSSAPYSGFTYYLKALLNETAKLSAFTNAFPELNHNEMVGLLAGDRLAEFRLLLLRDAGDHQRVAKRMDIYADLVAGFKGNIRQTLLAGDPFDRIVRFVVMANWIAYEASQLRHVDPFDVSLIENFKGRMAAP